MADVGGKRSLAFAVERRFEVLSRKRAGTKVKISARVVGGKRGAKVELRRQVGCDKTQKTTTATLGSGGKFSVTLPVAPAAEGVVLYRAVTPIPGGATYTLPIAVTTTG